MTRRLLPLLVLLAVGALAAPGSALAAPTTPTIDAPLTAYLGETVTLKNTTPDTADPTVTYTWDFGNGSGTPSGADAEVTTSYDPAGEYVVGLTATNALGETSSDEHVIRVGRAVPSEVEFAVSNTDPVTLEKVDLDAPDVASTAYEEDGLRCRWNADGGPAIDDINACHTKITWSSTGTKNVTLRVIDVKNNSTRTERQIKVGSVPVKNQLPTTPSLSYSPSAPVAGQAVSFTSKATDPDGNIESYEWDFNSDNVYEASGDTTSHVFPASGNYTVTVRATDNNGGSRTSFQTIFVSSPPAGEVLGTSTSGSPPTAPTQSSGQGQPRPTTARLLSPFPIVRLRGSVLGRTARISLLSIQGAPRGAKVRVRCRGGGCPRKLVTSTALSSRGTMRLRAFERRLRAGTKLEIYVTQSGRMGKYTRFEIRRNAAPRRVDRCVRSFPGKPVTCPTTT